MALVAEAMKLGGPIVESALREAQADTDLATGLVLRWAEAAGVSALMLPSQEWHCPRHNHITPPPR